MCRYEKLHFPTCGHFYNRIVKYCHFARNDPFHQCFGVQTQDRERVVETGARCPSCGGPKVNGPSDD
ncbi:hypothetical protein TWF730_002824 [Orbilia blumenaviensis]|uniref:Uncharacterized protein n=1 Tax=Orbilia blumenaviensis TaxID=1796055 RepID=A0AAV9UAR1_9PEZI